MSEKSRGEAQVVSSNFVTLYPLDEGEERFEPVLKSVAQAIDPQMKRTDIHQLLRQKIEEYGPETDNGRFVDKVLHFTLFQEAREFSIYRDVYAPIQPEHDFNIMTSLKLDFPNYYAMKRNERKQYKSFLEALENRKVEDRIFPGSSDTRKDFIQLMKEMIGEESPVLATELAEFIKGQMNFRGDDVRKHFFTVLESITLSSDLAQKQEIVTQFIEDNRHGYIRNVSQMIGLLKNHPQIGKDKALLEQLKKMVWQSASTLSRQHQLKNHHEKVSFADRAAAHESHKTEGRAIFRGDTDKAEKWDVRAGHYQHRYIIEPSKDERNVENIGGLENFLINRITDLLTSGKQKPVVFVDFGGQLGVSTIKLAKVFENQIKNEEVVLVVTNLYDGRANLTSQYIFKDKNLEFLAENYSHLVHFITADAQELQSVEIQTSQGKVPLKGMVSIIHENYSISRHGNMNDVDYPLLAEMLSRDGIILTDHESDRYFYPIDSMTEERRKKAIEESYDLWMNPKAEPKLSRKWGINKPLKRATGYSKADKAHLAATNLRNMGMKLTDTVYINGQKRRLEYAIWSKPEAMPIEIQQFDGQWVNMAEIATI